MASTSRSGQAPFQFVYRPEYRTLPEGALPHEVNLHGGFAVDPRADSGHIFYGMPGYGLLRIDPDLSGQQLVELPPDLRPLNFHSTKLGRLDGQWRLFLPANSGGLVAVVTLDGRLDFVLTRPELEAYAAQDAKFNPTDTVLAEQTLYVADGYGSNYISTADVVSRRWTGSFGGKATDADDHGHFATAHGMALMHGGHHLAIADRPSARIQVHGLDGSYETTHRLPVGAWPCGINYTEHGGRRYAVVGSLKDPVEGRPAPIYILDGETHALLSTVRPKEELGLDLVQHLHNVIWHSHAGRLYLLCQSWNPGFFFVLECA